MYMQSFRLNSVKFALFCDRLSWFSHWWFFNCAIYSVTHKYFKEIAKKHVLSRLILELWYLLWLISNIKGLSQPIFEICIIFWDSFEIRIYSIYNGLYSNDLQSKLKFICWWYLHVDNIIANYKVFRLCNFIY